MHKLSLISKTTGGNDVSIDVIATNILSKHRTLLSGSRAFIAPKYGITPDYDIIVDFENVTFLDIKNVFDVLQVNYSLYRHSNTSYTNRNCVVGVYRYVVGDNHIDIIFTDNFEKHKQAILFFKENFIRYHLLPKLTRNALYNFVVDGKHNYAYKTYLDAIARQSLSNHTLVDKSFIEQKTTKGLKLLVYFIYGDTVDKSVGPIEVNCLTDFDKLPDEVAIR